MSVTPVFNQTIELPARDIITFTADAASIGYISLRSTNSGVQNEFRRSISNNSLSFGSYEVTRYFDVECEVGEVSYTIDPPNASYVGNSLFQAETVADQQYLLEMYKYPITTTQMAIMPTTTIASLNTTAIAGLTTTQFSSITSTQLGAISTTALQGINSTQLSSITTTAISGMTAQQAGAYSTSFFTGLTQTQLSSISTTAIGNLTNAQLAVLHPGKTNITGIGIDQSTGLSLTTLTYNETTRTVTIAPTGATFDVFIQGARYPKTSQSVVHANTAGDHFIYFDQTGTLVTSTSAWDLLLHAPVAFILWDSSNSNGVCLDERHAAGRDIHWHKSLHNTIGTRTVSGFEISGYTLLSGSSDGDVSVGVASGTVVDEDIFKNTQSLPVGGPYTLLYKSGVTGAWLIDRSSVLPFLYSGNNLQYNQNNAGTWQRTSVPEDQFVNYWIVACTAIPTSDQTPSPTTTQQLLIIPGQTTYNTETLAKSETFASLVSSVLPLQELAVLWQMTFRRNASNPQAYTNTARCAIYSITRITNTGTNITQTTQQSHSALLNLEKDDHLHYQLRDDSLSTTHFANITTTQIGLITTTAIASLTSTQRGGLIATTTLPGFVPATGTAQGYILYDNMTWGAGAATNLTTTQFSNLTSTHIAVITTTALRGLSTTQIGSLTTTALSGLSSTQISSMGISLDNLSNVKVAGTSIYIGMEPTNISGNPSGNVCLSTNGFPALTTGAYNFLASSANGLQSLTIGKNNVVIGTSNAYSLTSGQDNIVIGNQSLSLTTTGSHNVAIGEEVLETSNASFSYNVAAGWRAGISASGSSNVLLGYVPQVTSGSYNVVIGNQSGGSITGNSNIIIGDQSGSSLTSGAQNIILGVVQNAATASTSYSINIGGIFRGTGASQGTPKRGGIVVAAPAAALDVDSGEDVLALRVDRPSSTATDHLVDFVSNNGGTNTTVAYVEVDGSYIEVSDERLKINVQPATPKTSDLLKLRVVNYNWANDNSGKKVLGLIAQQVKEVCPSLVRLGKPPIRMIKDPNWIPEKLERVKIHDESTKEFRWETEEETQARAESMRPLIEEICGESRFGYAKDALIFMLLKGFQELEARVKLLESR